MFSQHGVKLLPPVLIEQVPVAAARQAPKEPRWRQRGLEDASKILRIQARCIQGARHRSGACTRHHVREDAVSLKCLKDPKMSHPAGGAAPEGQTDLYASQMMDNALESVLQ